jgi:hypothetical protein
MKYEFKPFSYPSYLLDLADGWNMTFQVYEEYPDGTPREVEIVDLGEKANWQYRLASIDLSEGGTVRHHDIQGRFDSKGVPCCLDLIFYREAGPKPREVQGMAYVDADNKVVALRCAEDSEVRVAGSLHPVPCTITLHSQEHEST